MHNRFYGPTNRKGCLPLNYNNCEKSNHVQNIFDIFRSVFKTCLVYFDPCLNHWHALNFSTKSHKFNGKRCRPNNVQILFGYAVINLK